MVGKRNWAGSPEKIKQAYKTSVEWFEKRREIPFEELKSVTTHIVCFVVKLLITYSVDNRTAKPHPLSRGCRIPL